VQVDPAVAGNVQGRPGHQAAVGDDGGHVGTHSCDPGGNPGVHFRCVDDFKSELGRTGGDGRRRENALAACRRIRPGEDGDDVEAGVNQRVQ
jgi:hypothetical protein